MKSCLWLNAMFSILLSFQAMTLKVVLSFNFLIKIQKLKLYQKESKPTARSNQLQTKLAELRACNCEIFQFPPQLTRGKLC